MRALQSTQDACAPRRTPENPLPFAKDFRVSSTENPDASVKSPCRPCLRGERDVLPLQGHCLNASEGEAAAPSQRRGSRVDAAPSYIDLPGFLKLGKDVLLLLLRAPARVRARHLRELVDPAHEIVRGLLAAYRFAAHHHIHRIGGRHRTRVFYRMDTFVSKRLERIPAAVGDRDVLFKFRMAPVSRERNLFENVPVVDQFETVQWNERTQDAAEPDRPSAFRQPDLFAGHGPARPKLQQGPVGNEAPPAEQRLREAVPAEVSLSQEEIAPHGTH